VELSFNEAEDLRKAWFDMWPEMEDYFGMIRDASNQSPTGVFSVKQLYSNRVRGGCTYTSGANTYFQGLAADGAKAALWALYKACYLGVLPDYMEGEKCHLRGVRMWAFIHDEVLFEGDQDTAHLWAPQASRIMVEEMRKYTPDIMGNLVPWEGE
jgi:DNA polymerase I-like protein with 3'-5' exonuclease and polymerase domains